MRERLSSVAKLTDSRTSHNVETAMLLLFINIRGGNVRAEKKRMIYKIYQHVKEVKLMSHNYKLGNSVRHSLRE